MLGSYLFDKEQQATMTITDTTIGMEGSANPDFGTSGMEMGGGTPEITTATTASIGYGDAPLPSAIVHDNFAGDSNDVDNQLKRNRMMVRCFMVSGVLLMLTMFLIGRFVIVA